jgi:hypothetical protein
LADGGTIDKHNNSLAYVEAEAESSADGQFTATWAPEGRSVTVAGHCPACGGRTATQFSLGIGGSKGIRTSAQGTQTLPTPVTIFCECGHAHADRPQDALDRGCGRFWLVFLPEDERQSPSAGSAQTSATP